jgi:tRNA threonylcarbamoyladenosine biosynthesis protein TsaE
MAPRMEPVEQPRFLGGEVGAGDADRAESEIATPRSDIARQAVEVGGRGSSHDERTPSGGNNVTSIIEELREDLADATATLRAGARLAAGMRGGMIIALSGELGAGKTTLVRGMLRALGWTDAVKSPSYTLVEHYLISSLYFYHFDFYRFDGPAEWESGGFAEYFRPDAICVIEWPERVAPMLPVPDIAMRLAYANRGRTISLTASTGPGRACLDAFAHSLV